MVFVGTKTWSKADRIVAQPYAHLELVGFDADAEFVTVDVSFGIGFAPKAIGFVVARTAGSTDTVDIDLDGTINSTTFTTLATITSSTTPLNTMVPIFDFTGATNAPLLAYRKYRVIVNTVGSGNTLSVDVFFQ